MFQWVRFDTNVFSFISKCSSLEKLSIKSCSNIGNLDIDIPSLEFFHFYGSFEAICFSKASQNLSTVIIDNAATDVNISVLESSEPINLFQCLRNVEHLRLGSHFVDYLVEGTMPRKLSATLGWLRVLELPEIRFGWADEVSLVLCLVVSSPNLQKLEIGSVPTTYEIQSLAPEILKVQDLLDNALKKLRVVSMKLADTEVVKAELEFIKFLLAESVVLEKMFIQPAEGAVALKILKEVLRFQRSSTKAEIVYLDPDDEGILIYM
ncbi:F-box/FBD/LRR-repeat protein At1g13570-like isoform X2 [Mercurialis annua]|uniref:F-box/FBD/LRR-repeat protein At1g13570-like isoform X2 n=1 Tax=Mercurialis annua TaxID=3986 RepID=UPI0024AE3DF3|nr:F-box/FBD/LRR-repeat protein At1g13570-like isoform X2 [Mercurialis annua]XP_055961260.1 F-box/FBD/LRR-repeat protein At1g13570-like isoform X2 [Mercurialis annua]